MAKKSNRSAIGTIEGLAVLSIKKVPHIGHWAMPRNEWVEWVILQELIYFRDEPLTTGDLADWLGVPGRRVAGRCKALVNRGVLVEAKREDAISLYDDPKPKPGKAYALSGLSKRRITNATKPKRKEVKNAA